MPSKSRNSKLVCVIDSVSRKCLKEEIHKDILVTGEFDVTEVQGQKVKKIKYILCLFFQHITGRHDGDGHNGPPPR